MKVYIVLKTIYNGYGCNGVDTFDAIYDNLQKAIDHRESILLGMAKEDPYNIDDYLLHICEYDISKQKMTAVAFPNKDDYKLNFHTR